MGIPLPDLDLTDVLPGAGMKKGWNEKGLE
jgi:hypothetical protein